MTGKYLSTIVCPECLYAGKIVSVHHLKNLECHVDSTHCPRMLYSDWLKMWERHIYTFTGQAKKAFDKVIKRGKISGIANFLLDYAKKDDIPDEDNPQIRFLEYMIPLKETKKESEKVVK